MLGLALASLFLGAPVPKDMQRDPFLGKWELVLYAERGIPVINFFPAELVVTAENVSLNYEVEMFWMPSWKIDRKRNSRDNLVGYAAKINDGKLLLMSGKEGSEILWVFKVKERK